MPIYFSWFITALLSVSVVRTITTYRKVGAFLYCVKIRTRVQNTLQAIALNRALRRGRGLWTATGQKALQALSLPSYTSQRRDELLRLSGLRNRPLSALKVLQITSLCSRPD